jgi:predicted metal-dependent phosphotriesterase family hydrolase
MAVTGPVHIDDLGFTLQYEHLYSDARPYCADRDDLALAECNLEGIFAAAACCSLLQPTRSSDVEIA